MEKAPPTSNKETFQRLQLAALARSLQPVQNLRLNAATLADIAQFGLDVIQARIERRIGVDDIVGFKGMCEVLLKILLPQLGTQVNVTQVAVDPEQIVTGFLNTLPSELRNAIVAYGREQAKLEQVA